MQYRAIIKKSEGWWIGWLVDLPGVNAQERTKGEVIKSLKIGAEDMLANQKIEFSLCPQCLCGEKNSFWDTDFHG